MDLTRSIRVTFVIEKNFCWINGSQLFSLLIQKLYVRFKWCKSQTLLLLEWDYRKGLYSNTELKKCSILACFSCYVYIHLRLKIKVQLLSPSPDVSLSKNLTMTKFILMYRKTICSISFTVQKKNPLCSRLTQTLDLSCFSGKILWIHLCLLFLLLMSSEQVSQKSFKLEIHKVQF